MNCIKAPQLDHLYIALFNEIVFETPQFIQFISHSPILETFEKAIVVFSKYTARVRLSSQTSGHGTLNMTISCIELDWQVSSMEQVCATCLPPLSTLEDLYIYESPYSQPVWQDDIDNKLWLELLRPFPAVKNLLLFTPSTKAEQGTHDENISPDVLIPQPTPHNSQLATRNTRKNSGGAHLPRILRPSFPRRSEIVHSCGGVRSNARTHHRRHQIRVWARRPR